MSSLFGVSLCSFFIHELFVKNFHLPLSLVTFEKTTHKGRITRITMRVYHFLLAIITVFMFTMSHFMECGNETAAGL